MSEAFIRMGSRSGFSIKVDGKVKSTLLSGEGDLLSRQNSGKDSLFSSLSAGIEIQPDAIALGTLSSETTPTSSGFPTDIDEFDLDRPSVGFSSIPEAIEDIRQGKVGCLLLLLSCCETLKFQILLKVLIFISTLSILQMVVVVDDEDRENEGDLIMAASKVTPEAMAFIVKHGTGIVCVSMKEGDLERLQLPLMVNHKDNEEKLSTAFTVSVVCNFTSLSFFLISHLSY